MQAEIRQTGPAHRIGIPQASLLEAGLGQATESGLNPGVIEIAPIDAHRRGACTEDAQPRAALPDEPLPWPACARMGDAGLCCGASRS